MLTPEQQRRVLTVILSVGAPDPAVLESRSTPEATTSAWIPTYARRAPAAPLPNSFVMTGHNLLEVVEYVADTATAK